VVFLIDINHYRTISNSLDCSEQEADIYEARNALLYDFDSNPSCKTVLLNDTEINVIMWVDTDIVTGGKSYKIRCKPNQVLQIGDIIKMDNDVYFVTKVDMDKMVSYAGTLARATCILKFYKNGVYRELPCFITVGTRNYINERDNDFIRLPKSLFTAYCPDLGYLDKEDVNIRFCIRGYIYRAIGIDNLTVLEDEVRDGLIIMKLQDDAISGDDNIELGIANYWSNQPHDMPNGDMNTNDEYTIDIDLDRPYFICGETVDIKGIVKNQNNKIIETHCLFDISDENGNIIDYTTIVNNGSDFIALKISSNSKHIGKKIKLRILYPELQNITFERIFTIRSFI
jgi:hypothetical protein